MYKNPNNRVRSAVRVKTSEIDSLVAAYTKPVTKVLQGLSGKPSDPTRAKARRKWRKANLAAKLERAAHPLAHDPEYTAEWNKMLDKTDLEYTLVKQEIGLL